MKTSVITEFRQRYPPTPADPMAFGAGRGVRRPGGLPPRIDDPKTKIDAHTMLFIRGVGRWLPGAAEVVNMRPPGLPDLKKGVTSLPCIGDGRQSGHQRFAVDPGMPRPRRPPAAGWRC